MHANDPKAVEFKASRKFIMMFARRHNLSKRKKTNSKQLTYVVQLC